jgi:hypothetical protein
VWNNAFNGRGIRGSLTVLAETGSHLSDRTLAANRAGQSIQAAICFTQLVQQKVCSHV